MNIGRSFKIWIVCLTCIFIPQIALAEQSSANNKWQYSAEYKIDKEEAEKEDEPDGGLSDEQIFDHIYKKALVFEHPRNGLVFLYPSENSWYLMRTNDPRTGQPLGEGGRWSIKSGELCIDTALNRKSFSGCGVFFPYEYNGRMLAKWHHPFAQGLDIVIIERDEAKEMGGAGSVPIR